MDKAKFLRNVTLLSLAIDSATFGSIRIRDDDTGDVYTLPCGYVMLTETGERQRQQERVTELLRDTQDGPRAGRTPGPVNHAHP